MPPTEARDSYAAPSARSAACASHAAVDAQKRRKISVVIPFFQRQPEILARALRSIAAQRGIDGHLVDVIVVDDGSPAPPEPEIDAAPLPAGFHVKLIKQENAGPAAARNTGLAAVDPSCDYVAFIDSDDIWDPQHLSRALRALRHGEFYFANIWYDDVNTWFDGLKHFASEETQSAATAVDSSDGLFLFPGSSGLKFLLRECVPHTSTVVYDFARHAELRFDPRLRMAGEDYLFWLRLCRGSTGTCYSLQPGGRRGHGIDLYRSALDWNSPECAPRLLYNLILYKQLLSEFGGGSEQQELRQTVSRLRLSISYLLLRNATRHPATNLRVFMQLRRQDPLLFYGMPAAMTHAAVRRLAGRLDFAVG